MVNPIRYGFTKLYFFIEIILVQLLKYLHFIGWNLYIAFLIVSQNIHVCSTIVHKKLVGSQRNVLKNVFWAFGTRPLYLFCVHPTNFGKIMFPNPYLFFKNVKERHLSLALSNLSINNKNYNSFFKRVNLFKKKGYIWNSIDNN